MRSLSDVFRYDRQMALLGRGAQDKLSGATVAVVGVGGLGSNVAMQMAAMGIGKMILVDDDEVDLTNLNRQLLFKEKDVGKPKVKAAAEAIREMNSGVKVYPVEEKFAKDNGRRLLGEADVIVDGLDKISSKLELNKVAVELETPYVFASVEGYYGNVSTIIPGETACLDCFLGRANDGTADCSFGVFPPAVALAASLETSEIVSIVLSKRPALAGKLLTFDLSDGSFELVRLARNRSCAVCGETIGPSASNKRKVSLAGPSLRGRPCLRFDGYSSEPAHQRQKCLEGRAAA